MNIPFRVTKRSLCEEERFRAHNGCVGPNILAPTRLGFPLPHLKGLAPPPPHPA